MRATLCVLVLLGLAGCVFGDSSASIERGDLRTLVLQPDDLPRVFFRFDEGPQVQADLPAEGRSELQRFGRVEGWKARFRRAGSPQTAGPIVIESKVDLFESDGGAEDALDAARGGLEGESVAWRPIDEPGLGEESFAATVVQPGLNAVRHYHVAWRQANVTASLAANGFEGKVSLAEILALARAQERRIAAAAAS